jgi:ABC-type uncharacterized transport system substrate-binding protein
MVNWFREGLKESGYIEGRNVTVEYSWARGQFDRLPGMAAEFVRRQVAVIVAGGSNRAILAAKAATTTIPIVFTTASDPVQLGLVASLARPGGNLTGSAQLNLEVTPKLLELARELVPTNLSTFVRGGGLLSYGNDLVDPWPRAATYVDRILRGDKPGDLPVQFPTKFEMAVNLKTAKALGLAVPPSIMLRADEVIE